MPPSSSRRVGLRRREADPHPQSDADTPESISTPSRKKRRVSCCTPNGGMAARLTLTVAQRCPDRRRPRRRRPPSPHHRVCSKQRLQCHPSEWRRCRRTIRPCCSTEPHHSVAACPAVHTKCCHRLCERSTSTPDPRNRHCRIRKNRCAGLVLLR